MEWASMFLEAEERLLLLEDLKDLVCIEYLKGCPDYFNTIFQNCLDLTNF